MVLEIVTFGNKPGATGGVVPPLTLDAWFAVSVVDFLAPIRIIQLGGVERWMEFSTVVKLLDRAGTIQRTVEDFHVC